jgi:hypothetical protein
LPDSPLGSPLFALQQFQLGQTQQIAGMVHTFRRTLLSNLMVLAMERGQTQSFEMMLEQELRRVH